MHYNIIYVKLLLLFKVSKRYTIESQSWGFVSYQSNNTVSHKHKQTYFTVTWEWEWVYTIIGELPTDL